MEFRILGPLEVLDGGRPLAIRRGKEHALLAYLLLHANEVVPSGRLIDVLWDERPPPTASKILQNAVSHLRRELGDGRVLTREPGYLLRVEAAELDSLEFERLAKAGRPGEALALWRGPPLLELQDERFVDDARRHFEELRLGALEDRIAEDLAAGRHAELVPELEQLVAEQPLRERLCGQLMVALYRSGRQGEALEAYRGARRSLNDELGLQPSPDLQELEHRILNQDPTLAAPAGQRRAPARVRIRASRRAVVLALVTLAAAAGAAVGLALTRGTGATPVVRPNSVVAVDPKNNRVVSVAPVGLFPRGVAVADNKVWVANSGDGTITGVDAHSAKVLQTVGIGAQATELAIAAGTVWIATGSDNTLVKVDARAGGILDTIRMPTGRDASAYAVASGAGAIWVVSGGHLLKVDSHTDTILADRCCEQSKRGVHLGAGSLRDVAVGVGGVWVADVLEEVLRVSPTTARVTAAVNLGVIPTALTAGYGSVWVGSSAGPRLVVWRLNPATVRVEQTITVGATRSFIATVDVALGMGSVWATNYDQGTLVRIDPRSGDVTDTIHLGGHPRGIAVGAERVWVAVD
jgi:DNA-binding SARP family transcriptional activator/streptogramin lyase